MLTDLVVRALGVIEEAELRLDRGCTALTGETGAGKTLLVAALGLLRGARADKGLVREGFERAAVEARFELPPGHPALAEVAVIVGEDVEGEVVLARTVGRDGRSSARANGRPVTRSGLAAIAARLLEIGGQHEHHRLADPATQRALLDAYAGLDVTELAARVAGAVDAAATAERALETYESGERDRAREMDLLRFELSEIDAAQVAPDELEDLARRIAVLEKAEVVAHAVAAARALVSGEGGAAEHLRAGQRTLESVPVDDPALTTLAARLGAAWAEVVDVAADLGSRDDAADPAALAAAQERHALISRLVRKYGDVQGHVDRARARLAELEDAESRRDALREEHDRARAEAAELAQRLTAARSGAAPRLAAAAKEALAELAMEDAAIEVHLEPRPLYAGGAESVQILLAANPGEALRPLDRVASGGELARVALAFSLIVRSETVPTVVFDEVDAGVGGRAAQAVGRALARLAETTPQVLVVTHLPQVAAFAGAQLQVEKAVVAGRTSATVREVRGAERVAELSRMLAGLPESEWAREHAQELLDLAAVPAVEATG